MTVESAKERKQGTLVLASLSLIALVGVGVLYWANLSIRNLGSPVSVYEETCSVAYLSPAFPNRGSICEVPISSVSMPMSFSMSSPNTLHDIFFGVYLESGHAIRVSMSSTAPISLYVWLDNRTGYDTKALANEVANYSHLIANQTGIKSYGNRLLAQKSGLYIFELSVSQPNPVPSVSFDLQANDLPP